MDSKCIVVADALMPKLHLFDLLWICCTTSFTTNPRQIHNKSNKWSLGIIEVTDGASARDQGTGSQFLRPTQV